MRECAVYEILKSLGRVDYAGAGAGAGAGGVGGVLVLRVGW